MDFSGVFAALTTPFAADDSVAIAHLKQNIQRYNATGLAGYAVQGSTGESVLLSRAEWDSVLVAAKEAASPQKKLLAGTGVESTAETISRTKRAADLGYHAALVKTPYYYKPVYKPDVFIAHYRCVADASPIPVLLYSVPQFTGISLEAPEVAVLAEHPNIVGIKESSGHVQRVGEMIAAAPASFQVLTGGAGVLLPSLTVGAKGAILALASALPEKCSELYELTRRGQLETARELQKKLLRASKLIVSEFGIAGVKFVMDQRGYYGGLPRLPLLPLADAAKIRVLELLAALEPAAARA
ncbi:MAG: 4-hydroxy-tetrahydrodipicolinate synthase [Candidatus Acidoferrum typicum]|nr:4-hydroxy-tetrahydrodipicolinate synthase [Candidatus Acidoferrum typicum]